jgi:predicted nucleotidyltransferase
MVVGHVDLPLEEIAGICRRYQVRELSLFGSALRDDFRPDSDLDLLVEFQPNHTIGLIEYVGCQTDFENLLGRKVDLVTKGGLKRFVKNEILRTARVIYAT